MTEKPPYRVPSMEEIAALPWNGLDVVSTFSGCGGSCLGFKMAGYRVVWASEFVPAAQETYRANHPDTILDTRDIRTVEASDILEAIGKDVGELDVLEGSPPCASFSTAGKREKGWGQVSKYSDVEQRSDDLFFEYVRLIRGLQPKAFVAENVSGLVKGTAKGYFKLILRAMRECGYRVEAKLLDAQWLGVPQARQRIIFVGVRDDLGRDPAFPKPLPYRYTVREALPWVVGVRLGAHGEQKERNIDTDREPMSTVAASGLGSYDYDVRVIHDTSGERGLGDVTDRPSPTITVGHNSINSYHFRVEGGEPITHDPETGERITFAGQALEKEWDKLRPGETSDRYFNLSRPDLDKPSPTVTQRGGSNPGTASVTHPVEKRKFTIAELRRICAFPDDFVLTGTYAQRWERLGRSVPPVMMSHIARALAEGVFNASS